MTDRAEVLEVALPRRNILRIRDAEGLVLEVVEGCLWVTQDHDRADYVAKAGQLLEIERAGLTLVSACRDARIRLRRLGADGSPGIEFDRGAANRARDRRTSMTAFERVREALAFIGSIAIARQIPG